MIKTKKNNSFKVAGIMLASIMLVSGVVSGTMAKYTSKGTGDIPGVTPAKWDIKVADNSITNVDLSSISWNIYVEGTENTPVGRYAPADKIAPGTWGYATFTIQNAGEVDAEVTISEFNPTANSSEDGLDFKVVTKDVAPKSYSDAGNAEVSSTTLTKGATMNVYVCYQWQYNVGTSQDTADTTLGTGAAEITFGTLTITAEQVKPAAAA